MENEFIRNSLQLSFNSPKYEKFDAGTTPFIFASSPFVTSNQLELINNIRLPNSYSPCIVKLVSQQILLQILANNSSKKFASFLHFIVSDDKINIEYFMEANFKNQVSLQDMASLSGRSVSTCKSDFFHAFKTTPGKWLISKRLNQAYAFIKDSKDPISIIAYECGFQNLSHFCKAFKDKFGLSATQARIGAPEINVKKKGSE